MLPTTADIVRTRLLITSLIRATAVITLLVGSVAGVSVFVLGIVDHMAWGYGSLLEHGAVVGGITLAITSFVGAAAVFAAARPVAALIVPFRQTRECPACRYPLGNIAAHFCPECGIDLPPELATPPRTDYYDRHRPPERNPYFELRVIAIIVTWPAIIATIVPGALLISELQQSRPSPVSLVLLGILTLFFGVLVAGSRIILSLTERTDARPPQRAAAPASQPPATHPPAVRDASTPPSHDDEARREPTPVAPGSTPT